MNEIKIMNKKIRSKKIVKIKSELNAGYLDDFDKTIKMIDSAFKSGSNL